MTAPGPSPRLMSPTEASVTARVRTTNLRDVAPSAPRARSTIRLRGFLGRTSRRKRPAGSARAPASRAQRPSSRRISIRTRSPACAPEPRRPTAVPVATSRGARSSSARAGCAAARPALVQRDRAASAAAAARALNAACACASSAASERARARRRPAQAGVGLGVRRRGQPATLRRRRPGHLLARFPGLAASARPPTQDEQPDGAQPEGLDDHRHSRDERQHEQNAADHAQDAHEWTHEPHAAGAQREHHEQERDRHCPGEAEARDEAVLSIACELVRAHIPGLAANRRAVDEVRGDIELGKCAEHLAERVQDRSGEDQVDEPARHLRVAQADRPKQVVEDQDQAERRESLNDARSDQAARVLVDRDQELRQRLEPRPALQQRLDDHLPGQNQQAGRESRNRGRGAEAGLPLELVFLAHRRDWVRATRGGWYSTSSRSTARERRSPAASRRSRAGAIRRISPSTRRCVRSWSGLSGAKRVSRPAGGSRTRAARPWPPRP